MKMDHFKPVYIRNLKISGRFTIPSGIITTRASVIAYIAANIDEIGFLTTKTISIEPRQGYREPVIYEYSPGCFINAVGLANPGATSFLNEMKPFLPLKGDKPLFVSIMGTSVEEFLKCAEILDPIADAFELNLSCPHVKGAGQTIGSDPKMVEQIIRALRGRTNKPVIAKLSPNLADLIGMAELCEQSGADALCLTNTVGPGCAADDDGNPVLSNINGGVSGSGILPIGIKCVKEVATRVRIPIIASGGISAARDVKAYAKAGASLFAIGSALAGFTSEQIRNYFSNLAVELDSEIHQDNVGQLKRLKCLTHYTRAFITESDDLGGGIFRLVLSTHAKCRPGGFFFLRIPGVGEKPFSPFSSSPLTFFVRAVGPFTNALSELKMGNDIYFRGPYGNGFPAPESRDFVAIGGGTGVAPVLMALFSWPESCKQVFLGFSQPIHGHFRQLLDIDSVTVAVDGPNQVGAVLNKIENFLLSRPTLENTIFYLCGPGPMADSAVNLLKNVVPVRNIFVAREDIMRCGIGICGSCGTENGLRSCIDGPVLNPMERIE